MTPRFHLVLAVALAGLPATADAQPRRASREDLLDALTRHIQICAELTDGPARLACYDRLQTQIGDVPAPGAAAATPLAPTPTPLGSVPPSVLPPPSVPTTIGREIGTAPLAPPPLTVPGGGVATIGGGPPTPLGPPASDPDRAFNPRDPSVAFQPPPAQAMPRPQPPLQRSGPRPVPNYGSSRPVVNLSATNLTYGASHYWQVTVSVTSNVNRSLEVQVQCSFLNAGRTVGEGRLGPVVMAAGEEISTELIGPPTTEYVDSTSCRATTN